MGAGFPTFVEEENDLISLEEYLTDNIAATFMIRIKSEDLHPLNILKGDLAVIERTHTTKEGDIVLFTVNHKPTFHIASVVDGKTVYISHDQRYLSQSEFDEVHMMGVLKGLIRKY